MKSAITPSFIGRTAVMCPGVRPSMFLASEPTATMILPPRDGLVLHRDDRRLVEHDAFVAHVDQCVGGAQIDRQIAGKIAAQAFEHEATGELKRRRDPKSGA